MSAFDAYVQAKYHGGTMTSGPTFTVVHDAETPLARGYADSITEFFRKGPAAGTSAHAMVGPEKAVKLLPDNVVAYAAGPKANPRGWHLEQTGYASFTRAAWSAPLGVAQMLRVAACLREVHDTWGIPKRWCTDAQLRAAAAGDRSQGGISTHQQVARVLGGTTHTDPETNYPRDLLLVAVLSPTHRSRTGAAVTILGDDMPTVLQAGTKPPVLVVGGLFVELLSKEEQKNALLAYNHGQPVDADGVPLPVWVEARTLDNLIAQSQQAVRGGS